MSGACHHARMIEIRRDDDAVHMRLSSREAELMSFALRAGCETVSRAEYWIRHGVTQSSVRALQKAVHQIAVGKESSFRGVLQEGIEAEENPRRPRTPFAAGRHTTADPAAVADRDSFGDFLEVVLGDLTAGGGHAGWEDPTLDRFLGALAAFAEARVVGQRDQDEPSWRLFTEMIVAASGYE